MFSFLKPSEHAALQAAADNWNALVAAATEAGIPNAATLDAGTLLQSISDADPHSDQSAQLQQLTAQLDQRDATIASLQSQVSNLQSQVSHLEKQPGATPAQPVADSDPASPSATPEHGVLTGKESFSDKMTLVAAWAGVQSKFAIHN